MYDLVFKDDQVTSISSKLGIPKNVVYQVITEYVNYLRSKLDEGKTVKVLNVCYLRVNKQDDEAKETLAYISHELGNRINQSPVLVYRVLTTYEEVLIADIQKLNGFTIRGLIRIKLEQDSNGIYRVRTKKSTVYNGKDVYVTTIPRFKRKVEVVA